LSAGIWYFS
ncbi:Deoxyadenosine kinase (EC 2.7.1.76) / Deoxyguanosine kinase (EC 2.7.1.113), partial [Terribacillus sp. AE2B 122]